MFEYTLYQLKNYLLQNPKLEDNLPESYAQGLKNFNIEQIETFKPLIEALFNEIFQHQALNILLEHPYACNDVVNILNHMNLLGLFDEHHLNGIKDIESFSTLSELLDMLTTTGIIDNDNATVLFAQFLPLLQKIAASEAITLLLFGIGHEHDFEAQEWQDIIDMVANQKPEADLRAYILNLIEKDQEQALRSVPKFH